MSEPDSGNGWNEAQQLVMSRLNEHTRKLDAIEGHLTVIKVEIGILKTKSTIWGAVGGAIFGAIVAFASRFIK